MIVFLAPGIPGQNNFRLSSLEPRLELCRVKKPLTGLLVILNDSGENQK
jgi:hypothetical protein